jgi:hypothetical protein
MLSGSRPASNSVSGIHRRGFTKSSTQLKEAVSALKKRASTSLMRTQLTELLDALNDTVMGPEIVKMYQTNNKSLEDVIKEVVQHYKGLGTGPSRAIRSAPSLPPRFIGSSSSGGPSSAPAMIKSGAGATGISGAKGRGGRRGRRGGIGGRGGRGGRGESRGGKDMSIFELFALSSSKLD